MNELYHFGIKGMKWGRRRYQKEDGSYTSQGQGRYDNGSIFSKHYARKSEKYAQRAKDTDKDIKRLSKYRGKGIKDKDGNLIADKRKVESSIKGYEKARDKARSRAEYYKRKSKGEASDSNLKSLVNKGYANTKGGQKQREERMRKIKKAAKIGAGVAAAGLAAYGGYKLHGAVKAANRKVIARDLASSVKATKAQFDNQIKNGPDYAKEMARKSRERSIDMLYENAQYKMKNDSFATALKQVAKDRRARKRMRHDDFYYVGTELYHFGVKGMKWGVRHEQANLGGSKSSHGSYYDSNGKPTKEGEKAYKKFRRRYKMTRLKADANAANAFNQKIGALNKKHNDAHPGYRYFDNQHTKTSQAYFKDVSNLWKTESKKAYTDMYGDDVKKFAKSGLTIEQLIPNYYMYDQFVDHYDFGGNELYHFGVKGMKWGVRRSRGNAKPALSKEDKRYDKLARKDAKEYARAKMFYGESAGNRRKLIKNTVNQRRKDNAHYNKVFDKYLAEQNMDKHVSAAKRERKVKNAANFGHRVAKKAFNAATSTPYILMSDNAGNELYHFGVKGMKWGVRHERSTSGSSNRQRKARTDGDAERRAKIKKAVKVGAAVTALGLAMYGAYKLGQTGSYGKNLANKRLLLTDSQYKKKTFGDTLKKGVKREFERDIARTKKIPKVAKKAWKAGKEGFKDGLETGVRASGKVIGTGAVMGGTEYLLKRRLGEKEGGKVFSYGRQPIKKK